MLLLFLNKYITQAIIIIIKNKYEYFNKLSNPNNTKNKIKIETEIGIEISNFKFVVQ